MTTTTNTSARDGRADRHRAREERGIASASSANRPDRLPPAPRERRPMLAALAVLLIVGGAATAGLLALRSDDRVPVLVAAQGIAAGSRITQDALTTTSVAAEGTLLIPASQRAMLVGKHARVAITAGQLMDTAMVAATAPLQPGKVAVGASLAVGRLPASGLEPGDVVQLVQVNETAGTVIVPDALVSSSYGQTADAAKGSGGSTVTFIMDAPLGAQVAAVAAAGNLSAVLVTRGAPTDQDG